MGIKNMRLLLNMPLDVYTDGSCLGNPGSGGWAVYCPSTGYTKCGHGGPRTTNNRMELLAIHHALSTFKGNEQLRIFTDSQYCMKGIKEWSKKWVTNGWKGANGKPVKNKELWEAILDLTPDGVDFIWVKGHSTDENNTRVDKMAREAALIT